MAITSISDFNDGQPVWRVSATRSGYGVQFIVAVSDPDGQATATERDDAVLGLGAALTDAGFTVNSAVRLDVTTTNL